MMEKHHRRVLIIGLTWPEPQATAAGVRIVQIMTFLRSQGYAITFSSAATPPNTLSYPEIPDVDFVPIRLNCDSFDQFLTVLKPGMVIFDRFLTEEYFGWRVARTLPQTLRILDTQDLHSLRLSRESALKKGIRFDSNFWRTQDITKRELASIFRSDLSLIISRFEMEWLKVNSPVDYSLLFYLPFFYDATDRVPKSERPSFEGREDFVFLGNGRHSPNLDAIWFLKEEIWPEIRKGLPKATISIYGAHLPRQITALSAPEEGFIVKGWVPEALEILKTARVNLVPLRFGAGLKGKIFQAALAGTPSVMTPVACEGTAFADMEELIGDTPAKFASRAVSLYRDQELWEEVQRRSEAILSRDHQKDDFFKAFQDALNLLMEKQKERREKNIIGAMLLHHTMASSKYLSKWISLKEETRKDD